MPLQRRSGTVAAGWRRTGSSIVTLLYMIAAVYLTGMVPYTEISVMSGFPDGLRYRNANVASQILVLGELITTPLVVLVNIIVQPRLQYTMAVDGLILPIFLLTDKYRNLRWGTFLSGSVKTVVDTFGTFSYLHDMILAGILITFSMTDTSVVLLQQNIPENIFFFWRLA